MLPDKFHPLSNRHIALVGRPVERHDKRLIAAYRSHGGRWCITEWHHCGNRNAIILLFFVLSKSVIFRTACKMAHRTKVVGLLV
jgi:hypothetical protein